MFKVLTWNLDVTFCICTGSFRKRGSQISDLVSTAKFVPGFLKHMCVHCNKLSSEQETTCEKELPCVYFISIPLYRAICRWKVDRDKRKRDVPLPTQRRSPIWNAPFGTVQNDSKSPVRGPTSIGASTASRRPRFAGHDRNTTAAFVRRFDFLPLPICQSQCWMIGCDYLCPKWKKMRILET